MDQLGELGINLPQLIAQLVNFGILFLLLRLVAYKPIMKMLDERSKRVQDSMAQTEQIKQQATDAEAEFKKQVEPLLDSGRANDPAIFWKAASSLDSDRRLANSSLFSFKPCL